MKYRACKHKEVEHAVEILFLRTDTVEYCAERISYTARDEQINCSVVNAVPEYPHADDDHPTECKIQYHLNCFRCVEQKEGHKHCNNDRYPRNRLDRYACLKVHGHYDEPSKRGYRSGYHKVYH